MKRELLLKTLCYRLVNMLEALIVLRLISGNWALAAHGMSWTALTASCTYYAFDHAWNFFRATAEVA